MIISAGFWRVLSRHPATLVVVALSVGAVVLAHAHFRPGLPMSVTFVGIGVLCMALWPPLFSRSSAWRNALATAEQRIDRATVERIQALERTLESLDARQAIDQLRGLREKLASLSEVVDQRLNAGELAFARYRGTAEQVYLAAVDNLHDVAAALTSIKAIDRDYITRRESELVAAASGAADAERATLAERRTLLESQSEKIANLLAENESAMTALTNTAAALANVRMQAGHARLDATDAMAELESLASRAGRYAATGRKG